MLRLVASVRLRLEVEYRDCRRRPRWTGRQLQHRALTRPPALPTTGRGAFRTWSQHHAFHPP